MMQCQVLQGDNRDILLTLADNSIDSIVTDPPYGIDFLGKSWDANTGALETYQQCLRVLKPGGHILAFSAPRTYHHLAVTLEQAGFEIRDQIMWIYSSGFPKSQDVGKSIERAAGLRSRLPPDNPSAIVGMGTQCPRCLRKENGSTQYRCQETPCPLKEVLKPAANAWAGWGTQLKPAHEPIALARKPISQSIARNVQQWGVGALNIDATRIPADDWPGPEHYNARYATGGLNGSIWDQDNPAGTIDTNNISKSQILGRFPSNVVGEIPDYQKYFYCPKVSRRERHVGFDQSVPTHWEMAQQMGGSLIDHQGQPCRIANKAWLPGIGEIYTLSLSQHYQDWCKQQGINITPGNNHPTVKPIDLMRYLIRLITPPGGTVLDPFAGSGSTGCAAVELGHPFIGCELDPAYVDIAQRRIEAWRQHIASGTTFEDLFE